MKLTLLHSIIYSLVPFSLTHEYVTLSDLGQWFTLNSILRRYVYSSTAWLSELG